MHPVYGVENQSQRALSHFSTDISRLLTAIRLGANGRRENRFDGHSTVGSECVDNRADHSMTRCNGVPTSDACAQG